MDRLGLAPRDDDLWVRWVAVRHADDHVHVVATLARQDGRRVFPRNDFWRAGEASREVEAKYGLSVTAASDRTAAKRASYAETEKAARQGHGEPVRDSLRRSVRTAAAGAGSLAEFFERLADDGLLVRRRYSERNPGQVTGYAVALPESVDPGGRRSTSAVASSPPTSPCPSWPAAGSWRHLPATPPQQVMARGPGSPTRGQARPRRPRPLPGAPPAGRGRTGTGSPARNGPGSGSRRPLPRPAPPNRSKPPPAATRRGRGTPRGPPQTFWLRPRGSWKAAAAGR